ncbi:iron-sulfur cluster assembly protein [Methylorubrum populi]|uniref:iron-sulfur cluster assembly protein n=1 Tax=Methylorubrum populi TaxID=223967 RepID=UPI003AF5637C
MLKALSTVTVDPGGTTLPGSGRLSQVVIDAGNRVMFSILVDPSEAERFEPVRREAEGRVLALPGVSSVLASLTSERAPNAPPPGAAPRQRPGHPDTNPLPQRKARPKEGSEPWPSSAPTGSNSCRSPTRWPARR